MAFEPLPSSRWAAIVSRSSSSSALPVLCWAFCRSLESVAAILTPVAAIGYGTALLLSSNAVWRLYVLRRASAQMETAIGQSQHVGAEMLASEMASGSAGIQALAGLAAIVLGILALAGSPADLTLNLVALLALGSTIVLTGSTLSATVLSFMRT